MQVHAAAPGEHGHLSNTLYQRVYLHTCARTLKAVRSTTRSNGARNFAALPERTGKACTRRSRRGERKVRAGETSKDRGGGGGGGGGGGNED